MLAIAQSETPDSPWSLLCGVPSSEGAEASTAAVYFDVIYGVYIQFSVVAGFDLLVMVVQTQPGATVAAAPMDRAPRRDSWGVCC